MTIAESLFSIEPDTVHKTVLPNGLTVLVHPDFSAPVVAIVTFVGAGYFDETDDVVGIAHVLEHMYFKGTPSRGVGEIAKQTKAVGGYLNAATIYDHTSYYTVLPASGFRHGLEVQADAYANSLIDAEELARELDLSRTNVSNHLACLRGCGLIVASPEGRRTRYEVADPHLALGLRQLLEAVVAVDKGVACTADGCECCAPTGSAEVAQ